MEKLTRHHPWFESATWRRAGQFHKKLVRHRGFIIPMPAELHNRGGESLHDNVSGVPVILPEQARQVWEDVKYCREGEWLKNIDTAISSLYNISDRETDLAHGDLAHWAAENLVAQRSFIAKAVGGSVIYVMGA